MTKFSIDKLKSGHQSKALASQLTDDRLQLILSKNLVCGSIDGWLSFVYNVKPCRTGLVFRWVTIKVIPLKLFYYQTFFETWRN